MPHALLDFASLNTPLLFANPVRILTAHQPHQLPHLLNQIESATQNGLWAIGYLAYESNPLAWFALFHAPTPTTYPPLPHHPMIPTVNMEKERYNNDIFKILDLISAGDTYQVNYTINTTLTPKYPPQETFTALQCRHRHPYAIFIHVDHTLQIASLSPERLVEKKGSLLTTSPIKGTRRRHPTEDARLAQDLLTSEKERAEHIMIVDMARNDLGKICQTGSIHVPHLFELRQLPTVFHLESNVHGHLRAGTTLAQIMEALFPAASITGAPKRRTMEIISQLEQRPRGPYTGSMGVIRPGGDFIFNVAIRTLVWQQGQASMGLGGGIVADSNPAREWAEIDEKGRFLQEAPEPPGLIETFLLDAQGDIPLLPRHLARLTRSAAALGIPCPREQCARAIARLQQELTQNGQIPRILRLQLNPDGTPQMSHRELRKSTTPLRVRWADMPVDRQDHLLQHKTTRRKRFDDQLAKARRDGLDEVLFYNNLGYATEAATRALLVKLAGEWFKPPLSDGLLQSIWRDTVPARERSLTRAEVEGAEEIMLGNAVQGGVQAVLVAGTGS